MRDSYGTGYNPSKIRELGGEVREAAKSACNSIQTHLENDVVTPMSKAWFAGEAVDYFKNTLAPAAKSTGESIRTDLFNKFITNITKAGEEWAKATGNDGSTEVGAVDVAIDAIGDDCAIDIDSAVASILGEEEGGFIGIKDSEFSSVINDLPNSKSQVQSEIEALKDQLHSSDAFIGEEQGAAVDAFFDKIIEAVGKLYDNIMTSLDSVFTEHQTQNTTDAQTNASAWNSSSVTISSN